MRKVRGAIEIGVLALLLTACAASCPQASVPPSAKATPPKALAMDRTPKNVVDSTGATAVVTLNGVTYEPSVDTDDSIIRAIVDLTFMGEPANVFHYDETRVVFEYESTAELFAGGDGVGHPFGPSEIKDYTGLGEPVRNGDMTQGETKRELLTLGMSPKTC